MRLTELINLDVTQIKSDTLQIIGKGNKERRIFLNPATKKAITSWLDVRNSLNPQTNALFVTKNGTRVTSREVQDIVKKYLKKGGLSDNGLSKHKLRHTTATILHKYGHVDVRTLQVLLGHESLNTTQIYTSIDNEQLQSAINFNPLASMFGR